MHDPPPRMLGTAELSVLLCLTEQGDEQGYARALQRALYRWAGRPLALGTITRTLRRLEAKRLVCSRLGEIRRQEGGKRQVHYSRTTEGTAAVQATLKRIGRLVRAARESSPRRPRPTAR